MSKIATNKPDKSDGYAGVTNKTKSQWRSQDFSFRGAEGVLEPISSLNDSMQK